MNITSVKVTPIQDDPCLKAFVSIVIDSCFVIHNLKVIKNGEKTFVAMPNKPTKDNQGFRDIAHPLNHQTRAKLEKIVFEAYRKSLDTQQPTDITVKKSA